MLNTSFNENEPVVNTPAEALDCFLRTKMDLLVMGDLMVQRVRWRGARCSPMPPRSAESAYEPEERIFVGRTKQYYLPAAQFFAERLPHVPLDYPMPMPPFALVVQGSSPSGRDRWRRCACCRR